VTSLGNYDDIPANLFCVDTDADTLKTTFHIGANGLTTSGDSVLVYEYDYNYNTGESTKDYMLIDATTNEVVSHHFIAADIEQNIQVPYSLAVRPDNGDIYISDAKDYASPGTVYCLDKKGDLKWQLTAGI